MEQTVADVNNIPVTAVDAYYVGSMSTRSIDNTAVINVTITPENSDQETAVLEKVGYSNVFVSDLNAELEAYNTTVDSISDIERIITYPGEYIQNISTGYQNIQIPNINIYTSKLYTPFYHSSSMGLWN